MIAPARRIAYRILFQIATSETHSDELLHAPEVDALSAQDRALATTLVMGTLRWQLVLDARIRERLSRPEAKLSPEAATTLRMGAYQLLYLDRVPAHAVIHDSVELVKEGRERGAAGMVNAILRGIHRTGPPGEDTTRGTEAAMLAHPAWMVERWKLRYGADAAEAICRWDQEPAATALRVAPDGQLADVETEPGIFLTAARRTVRGDVGRSADLREGQARIQDEASQLVAELLAGAIPGAKRVLDVCAAPGGKTAVLAERLPEAEITAIDVSRKRLTAMQRRMPPKLASRIRFELADAASLDLNPEWDLILCDVPCSGTGTMARNPEIRFRVTAADLARQHARQVAILRAGLRGLEPGGRFVYSTCSMEPEENESVVADVLSDSPEFQLIPISQILDRLAANGIVTRQGREHLHTATEGNFLRTLPGIHACDGFFAAMIERRARSFEDPTAVRREQIMST